MNFRGTLTIGPADNPAACLMGRYKALHSVLDSSERVNSSCGIGKHMLTM